MLRTAARVASTTTRSRLRPSKAPLSVTETAAAHIKALLAKQTPPATGIRLGVKTRGCNGKAYTLSYAEEPRPGEEVVSEHGVTVMIEPRALMFVLGTTMDYHSDPLRSEFVFINPNVKGTCGCGESFSV